MNKLLWVLILLIAVAFGITGTMTDVFQMWFGASAVGKVFGRPVYANEFSNTRRKLEVERGRGQEVSEDEVWERIAELEEVKRCRVEVSREDLSESILSSYRSLKLTDDILATSANREERDRRLEELYRLPQHLMKQRLESIPFDANDYARLVSRFYGCSVGEYEELLRERLAISRLRSFVRGSAKMSTKELYEEFIETEHTRQIEYLAIHSKGFEDKVGVSDARLREFYEANEDRYMESDKIAFEYVMARLEELKNGIPNPNEDELKEYYEKWRSTYFRRPEREIPQPAKPDDAYKPYEEVKVEVMRHFLDDKAKEIAQKTLKDLKAQLDKSEELPFEKVQEIAKNFNLQAKETEPFEQYEFSHKFETEFGRCQEVATMFSRKEEIPALSKGKYSDPVECDHGLFIYRPSKLIAEHISPLEKVKDQVETDFVGEEAAKLAEQKAKEAAKEIKEQKEITRALLLKHNTYSVVTDFFANTRNKGKIPSIAGDYPVIKEAFSMKEIGEVSDPVGVQSMGEQIFYVVKYLQRKDPTPKDFKEKRPTLVYRAQTDKSSRFGEEWQKDLVERARITPSKERRPPAPAPPVEEEE